MRNTKVSCKNNRGYLGIASLTLAGAEDKSVGNLPQQDLPALIDRIPVGDDPASAHHDSLRRAAVLALRSLERCAYDIALTDGAPGLLGHLDVCTALLSDSL